MGVSYQGLVKGNHSIVDIAKAVATLYGGQYFNISFSNESVYDFGYGLGRGLDQGSWKLDFTEEYPEDVKRLRPWERKKLAINRTMFVFTDGCCKCDYADVTDEPMTLVSLGHWGECKEIINALVCHFGGFVNDEATTQTWEELTPKVARETNDRIASRLAEIDSRNIEFAKKAKDQGY